MERHFVFVYVRRLYGLDHFTVGEIQVSALSKKEAHQMWTNTIRPGLQVEPGATVMYVSLLNIIEL